MINWLIEIGKSVGYLLINPVVYLAFFVVFILGRSRVKRERRLFNTKLKTTNFEMKNMLIGIVVGILLSLITVAIGIIVPVGFVYILCIISIVFFLFFKIISPSAAYIVGIAIWTIFIMNETKMEIPFIHLSVKGDITYYYLGMTILLGLLLLTEGLLIRFNGALHTSPDLRTGFRGKTDGLHIAKKVWLIPIVLILPIGKITSPFDWWPIFKIGGDQWMPVFIPFLLGFLMKVRSGIPKRMIPKVGTCIFILGLLVIGTAVVTVLWQQKLLIISSVLAVIGRMIIGAYFNMREKKAVSFFRVRQEGVQILAIIPRSPAEKLGLRVGEVISKINGRRINKYEDIYQAMQIDSVYCRLEVLDLKGEMRLEHTPFYSGDHHSLGIIAPEYRRRKSNLLYSRNHFSRKY